MVDRTVYRVLAVSLTAVAAVLGIVAMFTAWWTIDVESSGSGFSGSNAESARPFNDGSGDNDDGIIESGEAILAGILVLFGILGLTGAAVLFILYHIEVFRPSLTFAPWLAMGAALLLVLAAVLAVATWPPEDTAFWDSQSGSGGGFTVTADYYAGIGWYLGLVAGLLGLAGGILWLPELAARREVASAAS